MRRPTLRGRALRIACAAALAAGIVPAAAWAGDPNPTADPLEFTEEVKEGSEAETPATETETTTEEDSAKVPIRQSLDNEAEASGSEGKATLQDDSHGNEPAKGSLNQSDLDTSADTTSTYAPTSSTPVQASNDIALALSSDTIEGTLYPCIFDQGDLHRSTDFGVRYQFTVPTGRSQDDYIVMCPDLDTVDFFQFPDETGEGGEFVLYVSQPGTFETQLYVYDAEIGCSGSPDDALVKIPVTIECSLGDEVFSMIPKENFTLECQRAEFIFGNDGEDDMRVFAVNKAAQSCFSEHGRDEVIANIFTDNPSALGIDHDNSVVEGLNPCTATLTVEIANGMQFTNTITVVGRGSMGSEDMNWDEVDPSVLQFTQKSLDLSVGQSIKNGLFFEEYIEGKEYVGYSCYIESSDQSVLSYQLPEDEPIVGDGGGGVLISPCKPGAAKLYLYFYNPETEESFLADTMTVNVSGAKTTGSSTTGSTFQGDIIATGAADDIVKQEKLSLSTDLKPLDTLTADQRAGLLEVANAAKGEKAIAVDISLVRPDGTAFDEYDDLDGSFTFTVRLKLEGELASLDPSTLRTYRIHEDGGMEPITSWVHEGYLYISTNHFSPYAIVGQAKSAGGNGSQGGNGSGSNGSQEDNMTNVSDKGASDSTADAGSKGSAATATSRTLLAQTGDALAPLAAILALGASGAVVAIALARRRLNRR